VHSLENDEENHLRNTPGKHARLIIEEWRNAYNIARPKGSLGKFTPKEFARFFNAHTRT
jgi:transposase InsO family protein